MTLKCLAATKLNTGRFKWKQWQITTRFTHFFFLHRRDFCHGFLRNLKRAYMFMCFTFAWRKQDKCWQWPHNSKQINNIFVIQCFDLNYNGQCFTSARVKQTTDGCQPRAKVNQKQSYRYPAYTLGKPWTVLISNLLRKCRTVCCHCTAIQIQTPSGTVTALFSMSNICGGWF